MSIPYRTDLENPARRELILKMAVENVRKSHHLDLSYMGLSEFPELPRDLYIDMIYAPGNKFTSIENLPPTRSLYCFDNPYLQRIGPLPPILEILDCKNTGLRSLPELPPNLRKLYASNCQLTRLPHLPQTLEEIEINGNPFKGDYKIVNDWLNYYKRHTNQRRGGLPGFIRSKVVPNYIRAEILPSFIRKINRIVYGEKLKEELVMRKYDPARIQANMERNQINMNQPLSEENWDKYYERRGEVWTEGISTAPGPWPKNMGREARQRWSKTARGGKPRRKKTKTRKH